MLHVLEDNQNLYVNTEAEKEVAKYKRRNVLVEISSIESEALITDYLESFKFIIKGIHDSNNSCKRLFCILDNIDFICHINDHGYSDINHTEGLNLSEICSFISWFFHFNVLSDSYTNLLFVSRDYSYRYLLDTATVSLHTPLWREKTDVYYMEEPSYEQVINARADLLDEQIRLLEPVGKKEKFEKALQNLRYDALYNEDGRDPLASQLSNLCKHKYRDLIMFLGTYVQMGQSSERNRLIRTIPVGLIAYIMNSKYLYSSEYSNLPNIYDSNIPYSLDVSTHHSHSYWLGRLIIELFYSDEFVNFDIAISVLNEIANLHEHNILYYLFNSFTSVRKGYLLKVRKLFKLAEQNKKEICHDIININLTDRGKSLS